MVLCACDKLGQLEHKLAVYFLVEYILSWIIYCLDQIEHKSLFIEQ